MSTGISIAGIGGIGDDGPAFGGGVGSTLAHAVVIIPIDPAHLSAISLDRVLSGLAHGRMDVDHRLRAEELRPPGDRAAVIAVGGGRHSQIGGEVTVVAGEQQRAGDGRTEGLLTGIAQDELGDGIGAAECLEAHEIEALGLVLVPDAIQPEMAGKAVQLDQWRRPIARPVVDDRFGEEKAFMAQDGVLASAPRAETLGARVDEKLCVRRPAAFRDDDLAHAPLSPGAGSDRRQEAP